MVIQAIDRASAILTSISNIKGGARLQDICVSVSLPKSTVFRILNSLIENGFVEKTEDLRYTVGHKIVELASLYLVNLELKTEAYPYMQELADRFSKAAHLAIMNDDEAVYIEKVSYINSIRMYSDIGKRIPLHCTAVGKVLLSAMSEKRLASFLEKLDLAAYTPETITRKKDLFDEIQSVRNYRVGYDRQEHEPGMNCVAAPIFDYRGEVVAALSLSGISEDDFEKAAKAVCSAAAKVSCRFGFYNQ